MSGQKERRKDGAVLVPGTRLGAYEVVGLLGAAGEGKVDLGPFPGWKDVPTW